MSGNGEIAARQRAMLQASSATVLAMQTSPSPAFRLVALDAALFAPYAALDDAQLQARGARRMVVDSHPGYPCRVSLADAALGERVILLHHAHHDVATPYRASGPIFVREVAATATPAPGAIPAAIALRQLSVRAYDAQGWMHAAEVCQGTELDAAIARLFADARIAYLQVHNAKPGCYACRVERA